jgi:hypothetical protein
MDEDCHADPPEKTPPTDEQACIRMTRLVVWGMYCPGCGTRIHRRLVAVKGVLEVYVDHAVIMNEGDAVRKMIPPGDDHALGWRITSSLVCLLAPTTPNS